MHLRPPTNRHDVKTRLRARAHRRRCTLAATRRDSSTPCRTERHFKAERCKRLGSRSRDPMQYIDGPTTYIFLKGNPSIGLDPTGLFKSKWECERAVAGKTPENSGFNVWPFGCKNPIITCEDCRGKPSGTTGSTKPFGTFYVQITICWKSVTEESLLGTLQHEFMHALDSCSCRNGNKILSKEPDEPQDNFCQDRACLEIRAYSASGECRNIMDDEERRACVKRKAVLSAEIPCGGRLQADIAIAQMMDQCYIPGPDVPGGPMPIPLLPPGVTD